MKATLGLFAATLLLAWIALPATEALARAGGGSSHSSGYSGGSRSSSFSGYGNSRSTYRKGYSSDTVDDDTSSPSGGAVVFLIPVVFIAFMGLVMVTTGNGNATQVRRSREVDEQNQILLKRIARVDDAWDPVHMRDRVEETFYKVQEAWTERNQEICRRYVSPRLYAKHKAETDLMLQERRINVLERISMPGCEIIHIADRKGTRDDEFWAVVTGMMIDYEVHEDQNWGTFERLPERFQEVWKFIREDHGWVLDKIDPDVAGNLANGTVISDERPVHLV